MFLPNQTAGTNKEFAADFLLRFTRELIENTETYQKNIVKEDVREFIKEEEKQKEIIQKIKIPEREIQKKEIRTVIRGKMAEDRKKIEEMYVKGLPLELEEIAFVPSTPVFKPKPVLKRPALRIPETQLPPTVSYLKPIPTQENIDLGNINSLVQDPLVKIIECIGPGENIFVGGIMGRKPTAIKLSQDEIEEILGKFAAASRIPVHEGLFKAAIGNLVISAVVSDIAGIKFVIRKISREF